MLLAHDKEHKKVFPDVSAVGFCNGKMLKDCLARAAIPKTNERRGKKTFLVCNCLVY